MNIQSSTPRVAALALAVGLATDVHAWAAAGPAPLSRARLEGLKTSSNDPAGDAFIGSKEKLNPLIDDFVADNSFASPTYLYLAANTAFRLGRVEDSGFLFYAAQLRKAFDFKRYDIAREPNGNNAATYLAFLNQTVGQSINPAIMDQPKLFASVIRRIEAWELVPSTNAFYPDFEEAKGFKVKAADWPAAAKSLKDDFLNQFGRRYSKLLADPQYFEALQFVKAFNFGRIDRADPKNTVRMTEMMGRMAAIEGKLPGGLAAGPPGPPAAPPVPAVPAAVAAPVAAAAPASATTAKKGKWTPEEAVKELASYGYSRARGANKPIDGNSLVLAANEGYEDTVELLLAAGVPVDSTLGSTKDTALVMSVGGGYLGIAAMLLKAGANVNVRDEYGDAPLIHLAKYCDEIELVRTFIKLGADVNASTKAGWTALKEAENAQCTAIAKELRKAGATK